MNILFLHPNYPGQFKLLAKALAQQHGAHVVAVGQGAREAFPDARYIAYLEFFYRADGADLGFDPEFEAERNTMQSLALRNCPSLVAYAGADLCITPTEWQASLFPAHMRGHIRVAHEGIDTKLAAPRDDARFRLPDGRMLTRSDEVVTYVARALEPHRGFHVFMRALPELLRRRPKAEVVIVGREAVSYGQGPAGGGSWKAAMLAEVGAGLDSGRVHFMGTLPYAAYLRLLNVSSAHVYLTYPFVLSWSLLEAMSCGCAIVASATGPLFEVIEDGVNGRLVDFFDQGALVEAIGALLDDPAASARLREAARRTAVERFDFATRTLPAYLDLLGVADGKALPAPARAGQSS
ncbi:MAG TPA: glycosyltransferase [Beijerinckiaceae bacterium]|nr:glycosyltransferase [Beijerinckiaceae bacterium]